MTPLVGRGEEPEGLTPSDFLAKAEVPNSVRQQIEERPQDCQVWSLGQRFPALRVDLFRLDWLDPRNRLSIVKTMFLFGPKKENLSILESNSNLGIQVITIAKPNLGDKLISGQFAELCSAIVTPRGRYNGPDYADLFLGSNPAPDLIDNYKKLSRLPMQRGPHIKPDFLSFSTFDTSGIAWEIEVDLRLERMGETIIRQRPELGVFPVDL
jgi:hypothetical protein